MATLHALISFVGAKRCVLGRRGKRRWHPFFFLQAGGSSEIKLSCWGTRCVYFNWPVGTKSP